MSLDVYLEGEPEKVVCRCPHCDNEHPAVHVPEFFHSNITHNLNRMAAEAGIYEHLWRPEEIGIKKAGELIAPLSNGLSFLRSNPIHFESFSASNGWGTYDQFIPWLQEYLQACKDYPEANVRVSR